MESEPVPQIADDLEVFADMIIEQLINRSVESPVNPDEEVERFPEGFVW